MNLSFTESQEALLALARQILDGEVTADRLKQAERSQDRFDGGLWRELGRAGVAGAGVPETLGGSGGGMIEICLVLAEAGRTVAPVPAWPSMIAAHAVARFAPADVAARVLAPVVSGEAVLTAASPDASAVRSDGAALNGTLEFVPAVGIASGVVMAAPGGLFLVDPAAEALQRQVVTTGEPRYDVTLDGVEALRLSDDPTATSWLAEHLTVGACATAAGIAEAGLRLTASYVSEREQFGRKLGAFQAVQQRAADAYITVEAMRWTMWQAAWRLAEGLPASEEVAIAASWAADGSQKVLAAAQHLHGGIGVDAEYPLHRFTLAGKLVELTLGGGTLQLARLGELMAR